MSFPETAISRTRRAPRLRRRTCCFALFSALIFNFAGAGRAAYATERPMARLVTSAPVKPVPTTTAVATVALLFVVTGDEQRAFDLINLRRVENNMSPLVWDEQVFHIARLHSESMAHEDFFAHTSKDGLDAVGRARRAGIKGWDALGENIAYNQGFDDPGAFAVERWMQSVKHRINILRAEFTHAALGVARAADGRVFFTQVFVTR